MKSLILVALLVRLLLIVYGEWHDARNLLKYTDIDYEVLNDGAYFVLLGQSPYMRATYRYTPLLSWLLVPNHIIFKSWGKLVFVFSGKYYVLLVALCLWVLDILVGLLMFRCGPRNALFQHAVTFAWLFNPLVIGISTRGNAESLVILFVIFTAYFLQNHNFSLAGAVYALAVHLKIYPIVYSLAILVFIDHNKAPLNSISSLFTRNRIIFSLVSGVSFLVITALFYLCYGMDFLENGYLYHIGRLDHRHNFSVYYLMIYANFELDQSLIVKVATFIPQALLLLVLSFVKGECLVYCWFLQTFVFVAYNKVCTSQYFLWFIALLPFVLTEIRISARKGLFLLLLWVATQGLWLGNAYRLEMLGQDSFWSIWFSGIAFFLANQYIIYSMF